MYSNSQGFSDQGREITAAPQHQAKGNGFFCTSHQAATSRQSPSCAKVSKSHRGVPWITERYSVKEKYFHKICQRLKFTPEIDCFSTKESAKCDKWWGPGSILGEDAMAENWAGKHLWINPPFSRLRCVVDKIISDQTHAILIMPEWPRCHWHKKAVEHSLGEV